MKTAFITVVVCGLACIWVYYEVVNYDSNSVSREALAEINKYRVEVGLNSLAWDYELEELAIAHSQVMKETDCFEHSSHPYYENILKGGFRSGGAAIAEAWKESPAHYNTMMSQRLQSGAVGIVQGIMQNYATFMAR